MFSAEERIMAWEERFTQGDHSDDAWCLEQLRAEGKDRNGAPLLFRATSRLDTLMFLEINGINLLQRASDGATLLTDKFGSFDLEAYEWLAEHFRKHNAIDLAEDEGLTPLAGKIRFGELDKARILLENGASPEAYATIARYGGTRIDIMTQAVLCAPLRGDPEKIAIAALKLLKNFGLKPTHEQKQHMLSRVSVDKPALKNWILTNFQ